MLSPGLVGPAEGLGIFESSFNGQQPARIATGGSRSSKGARPKGGGGGDLEVGDDDSYTTVMLRNIPNKYTRQMLVDQLYRAGFQGDIDYLYLPTDFANRCNVGYCFANLRSPGARQRFVEAFDGVAAQSCLPGFNSYKVCQVTKAKWQGREENVRRLRSSPELMAQLVGHPEWLPLLMDEAGDPEPFTCGDDVGGAPRGGAAVKRQAKKRSARPLPMMPFPGPLPLGQPLMGLPDFMPGAFAERGGRGGRGGKGKGKGRGGKGLGPPFGRGGVGQPFMPGLGPMGAGPYAGVPMMPSMPMMTHPAFQYMPSFEGYETGGYLMPYHMMPDAQVLAAAQYGYAPAWWGGGQTTHGLGEDNDEDDGAGSPDEGM